MKYFLILIILFICLFSRVSSPAKREISNFYNYDFDAIKCNHGKYDETSFVESCNCANVLGNGSSCEIEKLFNSTHIQVIMVTVPDHLDSWKKNLVTQFPNETIMIVEKIKSDVKGFVDNNIYFQIHLSPNVSVKNYSLTPRRNFQTIEEIFSKEFNLTNPSRKEEIKNSDETYKANETKVDKNYCSCDYITWTLLTVGLAFMLLVLIKLFLEDIKKIIFRPIINRLRKQYLENIKKVCCCPTKNRSRNYRSNTQKHELLDHSGNPSSVVVVGVSNSKLGLPENSNPMVAEGSNIANEGRKAVEEEGSTDFLGNLKIEATERSNQVLSILQKDNENNDIQIDSHLT